MRRPGRSTLAITTIVASIALGLGSLPAHAEAATTARPAPWSDVSPAAADDVRAGKPLVTVVVVPLCSNEQINCGSSVAGRPGDLRTNIYWGAIFGQKRYFDRKGSGWTRVSSALDPEEGVLERAVFRRLVPRALWDSGASPGAQIEQLVVLEAIHGAAIDRAVARFYRLAAEGGRVRFLDGEVQRDERVHVAGYAGHNRLMDGVKLPAIEPSRGTSTPIPSFVMACSSDRYFTEALRKAGSEPLVMTRDLMAPEGYVVEAITRALGENAARGAVRESAVASYVKWASLPFRTASWIFAPSP